MFGDMPVYNDEDEVLETQMLLGDRRSQTVADLFTQMFYRTLSVKDQFAGVKGMTLTLNLKLLKLKPTEAKS